MSLLIKNGRIVTAADDYQADIYIEKDDSPLDRLGLRRQVADEVDVIVLSDRVDHSCGHDAFMQQTALAIVPAEVAAVDAEINLLDTTLPDVADVHGAIGRVPAEALRIP